MKKLPEEEKVKIQAQVEEFRTEQMKFDREVINVTDIIVVHIFHFDIKVSKWDDNGNDVIVLAKHMCMIMMEMTDFTRGKGRLKTTMDVITAAKGISEAGTKLDKLARLVKTQTSKQAPKLLQSNWITSVNTKIFKNLRLIADQCPESTTKKDLLAYLQRIALYCHQLNITSKVK